MSMSTSTLSVRLSNINAHLTHTVLSFAAIPLGKLLIIGRATPNGRSASRGFALYPARASRAHPTA